jgi:acetyl esterase/lipase
MTAGTAVEVTSDLLRSVVDGMPEGFASPDDDVAATRTAMAPLHGHPLAPDTEVHRSVMGGVRTGRLCRPTSDGARGLALFAHGGAFVSCDLDAYLFYAEFIAEWTGIPVLTVDYRLAPEHPGPAALLDCLSVYRSVVQSGQDPQRLICIGDSCGGGLALSTVMAARDEGLPIPAGVVTLSGWLDLDTAGYGPAAPALRDAFITAGFLRARARDYVGPSGDLRAPWASPARGDLAGLPPLLAQVGETDVCRLDAERMVARAQAVGVDAWLDVVAGGVHGVQGLVNLGVPEAVEAWTSVRRFTDGLLPAPSPGTPAGT